MQSVSDAFTAEATAKSRQVVQNTQVAWKKDFRSGITLFTIGVSTIGGSDIIAGPAGIQSAWNRYLYDNESDKVLSLSYERSLREPVGGVSKALADVELDNTSGRYLPDYMGGTSAIFTAILPRRPIIINAGFHYDGVDQTIPQFVGVLRQSPKIDIRHRTADLAAIDFIDFLANKRITQTAMFTATRSDVLMEMFLNDLGFSTAQYELDEGRQTIGFLLAEKNEVYLDIMNKLVEAELGYFWQNEEGKLIFANALHWDNAPHNEVATTIFTSEVIDAIAPDEDHIINVAEITANPRARQSNQLVWKLGGAIEIGAGLSHELFVDFDDPMLEIDTPLYLANSEIDGSGSDVTSSVSIITNGEFAKSAKYTFTNNTAASAYITEMTINGRPAKVTEEVYQRQQISASVTAYEERRYPIENDLIQSQAQAETLAASILLDYAFPEKLQEIVIKARPELQLGDLVSWQGRHHRVWSIQAELSPSAGFTQRLKLLQRNVLSYFTIGVSTIGGPSVIAP